LALVGVAGKAGLEPAISRLTAGRFTS